MINKMKNLKMRTI